MSMFDFAADFAQEEELSDKAILLPKNLKAEGKIVSTSVMTGISDKTEKPWVMITLNISCHSEEISELMGTDEIILRFQPNLRLGSTGKLEKLYPNDNVDWGKLQKICEITIDRLRSDEFMEDMEEEDDLPTRLRKYYEAQCKAMIGYELAVVIGQRPSDNRDPKSDLVNVITKIAAIQENEDE